jgi:glutamate 5-kinase
MNYKRIIVKIGTNVLTGGTDALNENTMSNIVGQIAKLSKKGLEIIIVTSGAVAAGRNKLNLTKEQQKNIPLKQVLSSVGQSKLMQMYEHLFQKYNITVAQALLTKSILSNRAGYLNTRNTLLALLDIGAICIVNENDVVATDEIVGLRFGDNDNLSAMVANLVDADLLVLLTDIDGLYTADPHQDRDARLISVVDRIDTKILRLAKGTAGKRGTGGMITKIEAAKMATASGITVIIASGHQPDTLIKITEGAQIGTIFPPINNKMESKKRWMVTGLSSRGKLIIDDGAAKALTQKNRSLLPAGVTTIEGKFQRGDLVDIYNSDNNRIGYGISNYNYNEARVIKGKNSAAILKTLGYEYGSEIIHRNNLVLI